MAVIGKGMKIEAGKKPSPSEETRLSKTSRKQSTHLENVKRSYRESGSDSSSSHTPSPLVRRDIIYLILESQQGCLVEQKSLEVKNLELKTEVVQHRGRRLTETMRVKVQS